METATPDEVFKLYSRQVAAAIIAYEKWIKSASPADQLTARKRAAVVIAALENAGIAHAEAVDRAARHISRIIGSRVGRRFRDTLLREMGEPQS